MMNPRADTPSARVYFIARPALRDYPRLIRRHGKPFGWLVSLTISSLTLSRLVHVAVGVGESVLVPDMRGPHLAGRKAFERGYPRIDSVVTVPIVRPATLLSDRSAYSPVRFLASWATLGLYRPHTCVSDVRAFLTASGFTVPGSISSPAALRRFLIGHGCQCSALGDR